MRRCPGGGLELAIGDAGVSVGRAGIVLGAHPPVPQAGWVVKRRGGCGAGPRGMGGLGCAMPTYSCCGEEGNMQPPFLPLRSPQPIHVAIPLCFRIFSPEIEQVGDLHSDPP